MNYPDILDLNTISRQLNEYARLKYEYGSSREKIQEILRGVEQTVKNAQNQIIGLCIDMELSAKEPDNLDDIRLLRTEGPRRLWEKFDSARYAEKLKGAILGRIAGCILGAPVEFWSVEGMKEWAEYIGDQFPPKDYWSSIKNPNEKRYQVSEFFSYTKKGLNSVPVDDDIVYTILGLLIMEDFGRDFTTADVGAAWVKYLPYACTAEEAALENLKAGIPSEHAGEMNNPYVQWIGADIRSDPWGYLAPGLPEKAAEYAYRDAYISHRRNGIYGEMYFSAVIAAAFETDDVMEALMIGLTEIPKDCMLSHDIRWALETGINIKDYAEARKAVDERFNGMSGVHTNLNACLTILGLMIGGDDFTKVIGETVAMGYDNDCTAATAGSIFGAAKGLSSILEYWYEGFNNKLLTYINGIPEMKISDVIDRFIRQAENTFEASI